MTDATDSHDARRARQAAADQLMTRADKHEEALLADLSDGRVTSAQPAAASPVRRPRPIATPAAAINLTDDGIDLIVRATDTGLPSDREIDALITKHEAVVADLIATDPSTSRAGAQGPDVIR